MRTAEQHLARALELVTPLPAQDVPLAEALGRVTSAPVLARVAAPAFDNSAMDGYAVRAADLAGAREDAPLTLTVTGRALAGHPSPVAVTPGTAVRIMTGAPVPPGADAVVAQEDVVAHEQGEAQTPHLTATFGAPVTPGRHIRREGEDIRPGDQVLPAGVTLAARHVAAAAAAGIGRVEVIPRARVGYLVTGDELVEPGQPLGPGQIHDSNATYLHAALTALGAEPVALGRVGDSPDAVRAALLAARVHLLVTTGGASVGEHDPVKAGLPEVEFVTVAMQPGKPQGLGRLDGTPLVCLPGNPVAVAVSVEAFVAPLVRALQGMPEPVWEPARAAVAWSCPPGREQFVPVVVGQDGVAPATSGGSGSHLAARLAVATALARVPAAVDAVEPGDTVLVRRFTV